MGFTIAKCVLLHPISIPIRTSSVGSVEYPNLTGWLYVDRKSSQSAKTHLVEMECPHYVRRTQTELANNRHTSHWIFMLVLNATLSKPNRQIKNARFYYTCLNMRPR